MALDSDGKTQTAHNGQDRNAGDLGVNPQFEACLLCDRHGYSVVGEKA